MAKVLVIGGGPAGCFSSHMLSDVGHDVTLVDRAGFLGGSCRTFHWGGHPYTFGPRHFLTRIQKVWDFMNQHCPMKRYEGHEFFTYIERDQSFYHFPIHRDEVDTMPDAEKIRAELAQCTEGAAKARNLEEYWLMSVGPTLYDKFVNSYSKKMWSIESNTDITDFGFTPKGVALKTGPIKAAWSEAISGFPKSINGYDDYFDKVAMRKVKLLLKTEIEQYDIPNRRVKLKGEWTTWDVIISTISTEDLFESCYGPLRWMGRDFLKVVLPVKEVLPKHIYFLYYANAEPFTRIVEYKKFYDYESPTTLLGIEMPSFRNKLYPFPMAPDQALHKRYTDLLPKDVYSIGRMGTYRYLDMGNLIEQSFDLVDKIGKARTGVPHAAGR